MKIRCSRSDPSLTKPGTIPWMRVLFVRQCRALKEHMEQEREETFTRFRRLHCSQYRQGYELTTTSTRTIITQLYSITRTMKLPACSVFHHLCNPSRTSGDWYTMGPQRHTTARVPKDMKSSLNLRDPLHGSVELRAWVLLPR